jgi:dTDP-4-amino-4,6-dideoxygalactose transaminase
VIPIARPRLGPTERDRLLAVLDSGYLADGPEVREFETNFADYCGAPHGVATSNGTTALHAALVALGVEPGDHVVTTPFSFVATASTISHVGAEPVFADVDPLTYNLDPHAVESALRADPDITAILPVHLYGLACPMDHFRDMADEYDCVLLSDAAQAHGATYRGRPVGSLADAACFSFYPTKNMTAGEGGMIVTDDSVVAERARRFVDHGRTEGYEHVSLGHNFRLSSLGAAVGNAQLDKLPAFVGTRRDNAARLDDALAGSDLRAPLEPPHREHAYHQYTVRCPPGDRDAVADALESRGVASRVYYPTPIHQQPLYAGGPSVTDPLPSHGGDCPVAEAAAEQVLSIPVHPGLTDEELTTVAEAVSSIRGVVA